MCKCVVLTLCLPFSLIPRSGVNGRFVGMSNGDDASMLHYFLPQHFIQLCCHRKNVNSIGFDVATLLPFPFGPSLHLQLINTQQPFLTPNRRARNSLLLLYSRACVMQVEENVKCLWQPRKPKHWEWSYRRNDEG